VRESGFDPAKQGTFGAFRIASETTVEDGPAQVPTREAPMSVPLAFLKFVAKAALNAFGGGVVGDAVDFAADVATDVWNWWGKGRSEEERRADVEALVQAPPAEVQQQVSAVVREVAGDLPTAEQLLLETYLTQMPAVARNSLRRPHDPRGNTVPPSRGLQTSRDLIPLLPTRFPRFKPGDRPPGIGDWELVELLGVGGFGEVWKARNPHFEGVSPVALKFCLDSAAKDRLLRHEAGVLNQVMKQGKHPGIVALLHTYLGADPPCLEYEFVNGGDLSGLLFQQLQKDPAGLSPVTAHEFVLQLARTMSSAHQLKPPVVHRDLKPANVLCEQTQEGVRLRITDFGIGGVAAERAIEETRRSRSKYSQLTAVGGAYSPLYASPQQMEGAQPEPRDDVYALGVIWFQLLVGDLTKGAPTGGGWRKTLAGRGVSEKALALLDQCFEGDAAERLPTATDLAQRLEELLRTDGAVPKPIEQSTNQKLNPKPIEYGSSVRYWVIAVYHADRPEEFRQVWRFDLSNNVISVGWARLGDTSSLDEQALRAVIDRHYADKTAGAKESRFRMLWNFYHSIKPGDIVVAREGLKKIKAVGTVTSRAYYDAGKAAGVYTTDKTYPNHIDVRWHDSPRDKVLPKQIFARQTLYEISQEKFRGLVENAPV
jgi:serine/threonine protein kinase